MTEHFDSLDEPAEPSATPSQFELMSIVVDYDGRPDRCTISPTETTCLQRMSWWITADAFASLDERC